MQHWVIITLLCGMFLGLPNIASAFQSHPAPEGLYVHQLAHALLIIAMSVMVYWLQVNHFVRQRGWRYIQIACLLFIIWNMITIAGHWIEEKVPASSLLGDPDWTQRISFASSPWTPYYYFLKLDHFICVPAIFFLFLGTRNLYHSAKLAERHDS